jgi:outer membrane protein TolC
MHFERYVLLARTHRNYQGTLFGSSFLDAGPRGAEWPLLDFGTLDAQVDIAQLAARASMVNYRKTILNAVQQVDTSLMPMKRNRYVWRN